MKSFDYNPDDRIAALATPLHQGALSVFRLSGPDTIETFAALFSRKEALLKSEGHRVVYGYILDPADKSPVDEVLVTVFRAPRSYTGQESLEISGHGSPPVMQRILGLLVRHGFRQASPGEFTFRAYINKKLDLSRAEAVQEIIAARSGQASEMAFDRLCGSVEKTVNLLKEKVVHILSWLELHLDYPDDEIEPPPFDFDELNDIRKIIGDILATYSMGKLYQEGIKVVLAGKTNAGKSSLFNLFLKEERSIVSDTHGTTRDYLESSVSIAGIPVTLYDTAGLRSSDDHIEAEGIRRSEKLMEEADLILYVADAVSGLRPEEQDLARQSGDEKRLIWLWNKSDLSTKPAPRGFISISAVSGEGFSRLEEELTGRFLNREVLEASVPVIDSERQKVLLEKASDALDHFDNNMKAGYSFDILSEDLQEALDALGELTGEVTPEDILETMFSRFCVGK